MQPPALAQDYPTGPGGDQAAVTLAALRDEYAMIAAELGGPFVAVGRPDSWETGRLDLAYPGEPWSLASPFATAVMSNRSADAVITIRDWIEPA